VGSERRGQLLFVVAGANPVAKPIDPAVDAFIEPSGNSPPGEHACLQNRSDFINMKI